MATSQADIHEWLKEAKQKGCSHMIVVCDTFDHEDYPVFVMPNESVKDKLETYKPASNMQRVMEVYSLSLPIEPQLAEHRAYHVD